MKKISIVFVFIIIVMLCACGSQNTNQESTDSEVESNAQTTAEDIAEATAGAEAAEVVEEASSEADDFDLIGSRWKREGDFDIYLYFETADLVNEEFILSVTTTNTINGSSTTRTSKSKKENPRSWSREGNNIIIDESEKLELIEDNGTYKLSGSSNTYIFTEEDPLADTTEDAEAEAALEAEPYTVNDTIATDTIEMTFTEKGIAEDIRITSNESGISITSGPVPESGKKFIYIKGKVKNLDKAAINTNMTGTFVIDDYSFNMLVHTANSAGSPSTMIEPLEEMTIILYAAVSNDLIDNYSEASLTFGFNDSFNMVTSLSEADHTYKVSF